MKIGVPKEIKEEEKRIAITPAGVKAFVSQGHSVYIEKGAGLGSHIPDELYRAAGAKTVNKASSLWERSDMIVKVKEPVPPEYQYMREGLLIYTFLHLAADLRLTETLLKKGVVAFGYETIQLDDGSLPLLAPMSEVAGSLSIQVGAACLESKNGGMGILLGGVSGVMPGKVTILGAGIAGTNAARIAFGMGARVCLLDVNPARLRYVSDIMQGHIMTVMSNEANIEVEVSSADLVIGAVLIPGAKAPKLVSKKLVKQMKKGAAIVDISVDQGGCCETSRPTTHSNPTYIVNGVVHYCVTNMPGAVPNTSTYALTNATLSYGLEIANKGYRRAIAENPSLRKGLNISYGEVNCPGVAEAFGMECTLV